MKNIIFEYEMFFESNKDDSIKIDGWYPIANERIRNPENIDEYIEKGWLRKISKITNDIKTSISNLENKLEYDATLISEAIEDIITIVRMNDDETSREFIRKHFVVINRQDINEICQ